MPPQTLTPDFLPENCQALLHVLAMSFPGKGKGSLLKLLRTMDICDPDGKPLDTTTLSDLLESLQEQGWVSVDQRREGQYFVIPAQRRNSVLLSLLGAADGRLRLQQISDSLPALGEWQFPGKPRVLQDLWLNLFYGSPPMVQQSLHQADSLFHANDWARQHPMHLLQSDPAGLKVFEQLDETVRGLLLEDHLRLNNSLLGATGESYALALREMAHHPYPALDVQLMEQALWRGDSETLRHCGEHCPLTSRTLHSMLRGQTSEALVVLRSWLTEQRRQTKKRKIDLPPLLNAMYSLALFAENDSQHYAALKQALVLGKKEQYGNAYWALYEFFEQLQGNTPNLSYVGTKQLKGLDGLMHGLAAYWLDAPFAREQDWRTTLQDYRDELDQRGYAWLAAEFDVLISAQFDVPRHLHDLHQDAGLQPLAALLQRRAAWQHALDALSQLKPASAPASNVGKNKTRLAWLVNPQHWSNKLEPREQKLGAKGQWSKGRPVALKRLMDEVDSLDFLCEQDRQAISGIQANRSFYSHADYELPLGVALPRLVGHPALFWHDAPDVRVELETGHASLHLQAGDGQIHLRLDPQGLTTDDTYYLHRQTPTRLQIYSLNGDLRQVVKIIGQGLSVPLSGKAQLLEAVSAIAPLLPIHSDLPELAAQLDQEPADPRLYAYLLPLAEGLRLQLLVRPLAESSWFRPGQGAQNVLGERDGKPLQVCRDLTGERQALQQLLQACPGLANANSDGQEWQLDQPQDALQVLAELHALDGNQVHCIWPEGERMRIKGRLKLDGLKLGVRKQGEWFLLQGEMTFDDGEVLRLRQLLELIKSSPGRFLRLNEHDWLALDDKLRKHLDELAYLSDRVTDQGLRLNPLTTPILAGLAAEVGEFTADESWHTHLQKLQSLRDYQPRLPRTLQADLRAYQHEGFIWLSRLAQWGVGACLADDMGLGKTVQVLAILLQRATGGAQLVVAPTSVILNWQAESRRFAPHLKLHLYHQERNLDDLGPGDLVITSYGLLQQDSAAFAARSWNSVVLDEAQAIKNAQTKRSQAVMALQSNFRVVATGTPLENHLGELWNLFHFINPGLLGSQESFNSRFAQPIEQGDAAARRALKALIQPFILRRLKSQVLDELPARTEITYKVPLSDEEAHLYEALRQQAVSNVSASAPGADRSFRILTEITRLRRFCCHPSLVVADSTLPGSKLQAFAALVEELLENGHRALVFSQYVDHLNIVRTLLDEKHITYQYLDGSVLPKERERRVNAFQAGMGEIFLISLKAGGSGLNLTAADYVIHLDPWWNPAVEDQASDRAYRIGQQRPVTIYRLVAENSIEEQIVGLHARKRDLADSLLEGGEMSAKLDADALLALLAGTVH